MFAKLTALLKSGVDPKWIVVLAWLVGVQKGIGQGAISLTNMVPDSWIPHIIAWNNGLAWLGVGLMGLLAAISSNATGPLIPNITLPKIDVTKGIVNLLIAAFVLSLFLPSAPAMAQGRQPAKPVASGPTGDPAADLSNLLKRFTIAPAPSTPDQIQSTPCDFTIFSKLTIDNVVPLLEKCAQSVDQNAVAPLVADTQAALASAQAYGCGTPAATSCPGNGMAIACLVPALSLLKAAQGTPPVKDATGVVTTPGVAAGVVTIGEKLDEFVQAGGPSNCKAVVQRTINGLAAAAITP